MVVAKSRRMNKVWIYLDGLWEVGIETSIMHFINQGEECIKKQCKKWWRSSYFKHCSYAFVYVYFLVQSNLQFDYASMGYGSTFASSRFKYSIASWLRWILSVYSVCKNCWGSSCWRCICVHLVNRLVFGVRNLEIWSIVGAQMYICIV